MKSKASTTIEVARCNRFVLLALCGAFVLTTGVTLEVSGTDLPGEPFSIDRGHQVLGELAPGEERTVVFNLLNTGQNELRLLDLATTGDGMVLHSDDCQLAPGASGIITAMVTAGQEVGPWWVRGRAIVRMQESDGGSIDSEHPIAVSGFVNSAYDPVQPAVDLGIIDPEIGGTFEFQLSSREVPSLEVGEIEVPDGFSVQQIAIPDDPQAVKFKILFAPGAEQGVVDTEFIVRTNVSRQPVVRIRCHGNVYGNIVPNPLPVRFWRSDGYILGKFELRSRTPRAMVISGTESSPPGMILLGQEPCAQAPTQCVEIAISPRKMRPLAAEGTIDVSFEDGSVIRIPFVMKTFASQGLRQLIPFLRQTALAKRGGSEKHGVAPTLRWEVDGDTGVFGYIVYRSRQVTGPFVRMNSQMMAARGTDPGEKAGYEFIDNGAEMGVDFFYYAESVLVDGSRKQLTESVKRSLTKGGVAETPES